MLKTSELPFQSSPHGHERRNQRDVSIRDLQAAVKYGVREKGYPHRTWGPTWKYTFADVVYITNYSSTIEITSWALSLPLSKAEIPVRMQHQYNEAKRRIALDPSIITSHTVIVVDKSASMRNSDVNGHRTRARCVYFSLAEDFCAAQLRPVESGGIGGELVNQFDVVTLIEMRDDPKIIFQFEPISWVLHNKFVDLSEINDSSSHGNYYHSVIKAFEMLDLVPQEKCAKSIFFLSDGKPSDNTTIFKRTVNYFPHIMYQTILQKCKLYKPKELSFVAVGFGDKQSDFNILETMVSYASLGGAVGSFHLSGLNSTGLKQGLSSVISSTTNMRTQLSRLNFAKDETTRVLKDGEKELWREGTTFSPAEWDFFNTAKPSLGKVERSELTYIQTIANKWCAKWILVPLQNPNSTGIASKKKYFGEGAERIVYEMTEIDAQGNPVGIPLVAKESRYVEKKQTPNSGLRESFHKTFVKTQKKAAKLASKFNGKLDNIGVDKLIPRIHFLPCSVYVCENENIDLEILCEKKLKVQSYMKWNDNAGNVDGITRQNNAYNPAALGICNAIKTKTLPDQLSMQPTNQHVHLNTIAEDEEEEEDDGDEDEDEDDVDIDEEFKSATAFESRVVSLYEQEILDDDIPQAFTHFTYVFTKRREMVCDLQGVLSSSSEGFPVFELTDPCIHSNVGTSEKYGRTNKGSKGFHQFFQTHHCNAACKLLGLYRK